MKSPKRVKRIKSKRSKSPKRKFISKSPKSPKSPEYLNEDVVGHIMSYLPTKDKMTSSKVSKTWNTAVVYNDKLIDVTYSQQRQTKSPLTFHASSPCL